MIAKNTSPLTCVLNRTEEIRLRREELLTLIAKQYVKNTFHEFDSNFIRENKHTGTVQLFPIGATRNEHPTRGEARNGNGSRVSG